ncbi:MAG: amidohydrolase [Chloroflexota bacterium]|nr:amidohydrolase [Chloroflexota bacterium]
MRADLAAELVTLSREIHDDPELAYEEHRAVERIAAVVERHGHRVERGVGAVATAFRARVGPPTGPAVSLLAEYDALPTMGHACGHNLIAMTTVGAFLLAAEQAAGADLAVELVGTPAEEGGGGKIKLLRAGVFTDTVAALSSHASAQARWVVSEGLLGRAAFRVRYAGVAAHATVSPEDGRSALDAVIALFNGVALWRQRLPAGAHANGIITAGGEAMNIVPAHAEAHFSLRARTAAELDRLIVEFGDVAKGAALQTGTTVEVVESGPRYDPPLVNPALAALLGEELGRRGIAALHGAAISASSDIGNLSQRMPADYIAFPVSPDAIPGHSIQMREAAISQTAHANAAIVTEVLAAAALRIARDAELRDALAKAQPDRG